MDKHRVSRLFWCGDFITIRGECSRDLVAKVISGHSLGQLETRLCSFPSNYNRDDQIKKEVIMEVFNKKKRSGVKSLFGLRRFGGSEPD